MLRSLRAEGREYVSGTVLADVHHLEPVIVRKDLAATGIVGTPRLGFRIADMIRGIECFLGWDRRTRAVVVGCGNLGSALLGYRRFDSLGLEIVGSFDCDARKAGHMIHKRPVMPMTRLAQIVAEEKVTLGLLAVPAAAAQETASFMVKCGIRGIWNFAPVKLKLPEDVIVQKEDLAEGLAVLGHRLYHAQPSACTLSTKRNARAKPSARRRRRTRSEP
jgi:redox-sensing transcriptional repressor